MKQKPRFTLPLDAIIGPITYAWRRNDEWLYVGASKMGVRRLDTHTIINTKNIQEGDTIQIWTHTNKSAARRLERELIIKHYPKYNRYCGRLRTNKLTGAGRGTGKCSKTEVVNRVCARCGAVRSTRYYKWEISKLLMRPDICKKCVGENPNDRLWKY